METDEYTAMAAAEDRMWWYTGLHEWMLDRIESIPLAHPATALDCGAGTGGFARKLNSRFPAISLFAADIDAQAVHGFTTKSDAPVAQASVNELPFRDNSFDLIVSSDLLYHTAVHEASAIRELRRCLKPGGTLLLNLPAYRWMKSAHDSRVHTARRYTASGAARKIQAAGFAVRESTYRNSLLFPVMALFRLTVGHFTKKSDVGQVPRWQNSLFGTIISYENALARRGVRFPFGGSVYLQAVKQ